MTSSKKIEIMAPVGSYESLMAAVKAGADSVYFGIEQLNMRARSANNFTIQDLKKIVAICQEHKMRSYITLNTVMYDHDMKLMKNIVDAAKESGITAVIAADQAVIAYARSKNLEVHISTQINISNIETVKFYAMFADVIVLARELTLNQVKKITEAIKAEEIKGPSGNLIEVEIFAHGALCMAVSGKCYLSLHTANSSANRGACKQNCRRSYEVKDDEGNELLIDNEYIMSPKDLCTIDFIDRIVDSGVTVLKIEGRGRAPEYVYEVVQCYKEAVEAYQNGTYTSDKIQSWMKRLETVYNRGFWDGYYLGRKLGEWTDSDGSKATQKKVYVGKGVHYFGNKKIGQFVMESFYLSVGDEILITGPTTGVVQTTVKEIWLENKQVEKVEKGDNFTIPVEEIIRSSDRLYKIVSAV